MLSFYWFYIKKFFSIINKVLLVLTVYFLVFFLFSSFTQKNKTSVNVKTEQEIIKEDINYYKKVLSEKDPTKEKYFVKTYQASLCFLSGQECQNKKNDQENYKSSFSGWMDKLFTSIFFIPPASSIYWAHNSLEKAQLIPKSYAQSQAVPGIGLASLQMVYKLWENVRNLSFILIVLVLITIGFMIMFRMKMNPQTVISVENALPKIITTLILITFSYPIVGLLIDLVYISLPIIRDVFSETMPPQEVGEINNIFQQFTSSFNVPFSIVFDRKNFGMYIETLATILGGRIFGASYEWSFPIAIFFQMSIYFLLIILVNPIADFITKMIGNLKASLVVAELDLAKIFIFVGLLLLFSILIPFLIVFFGMLLIAFRIFFTLISCLINLIIYIVLAPVYLLLEAIPGKSSFSSWIKNILGNLIVIPGFLFLILLAKTMYYNITYTDTPLLYPGLSIISANKAMAPIIATYIFLMIPDLLKVIKQTIIGKESLNISASPGMLFGAASTVGSTAMGFANQLYILKQGYDFITGKKQPPGKTGSPAAETDKNQPTEQAKSSLKMFGELFKPPKG